jgi:kynurenine formamidase
MTRLVDLSARIDPADRERMPPLMKPLAKIFCPDVQFHHPASEAMLQSWTEIFGIPRERIPDGQAWGAEDFGDATTHWGTHVDAPLHCGATSEGKPARTITDIALEELYVDGYVLDLRACCTPGAHIPLVGLKRALDTLDTGIKPGSALLLRTGQERFTPGDPGYFDYPGMSREGTLFLASTGAKILGVDSLGWDLPFAVMRRKFAETGDPSVVWDGHRAVRERELFIVQQMANLGALPSRGFKVGFFPIAITGASAGPARVVAFID